MLLITQPLASSATGLDSQLLAAAIMQTLQYPVKRISITDLSERPEGKAKGRVLGLLLESKDGTFARLAIGVTKRGAILTPQLESECEQAAKKVESLENRVSKVSFTGGAYGYTGLGLLGPGGSSERIVATWPNRGIDLQLSITVPSDGLSEDGETQAYQRLINQGGSTLAKKLLESMKHVFDHVEKSDMRVAVENITPTPQANSPGLVTSIGQNPLATAEETVMPTTLKQPTSSTPWSVASVLIVAVIGLLWLLFKGRK